MFLTRLLNQAVQAVDHAASRVQVRLGERRGALVTLFFHNVFLDEREVALDQAYPQQRTTVADLRRVIEYFQTAGYRFITPDEILRGLKPDERCVLLTFDDGYFNNQRALPLMEQFNVPALFFIPSELVLSGKCYWWDVLWRERRTRGGCSVSATMTEVWDRVAQRADEIEAEVIQTTGQPLRALGDADRLFTAEELAKFAVHPLVHIGNHGCSHECLTAYSQAEVLDIVKRAQQQLARITGKAPTAIAYPYGLINSDSVAAAREAGLKLGFITEARKFYRTQASEPDALMRIGRNSIWSGQPIEPQCELARADLMWHARYRAFVARRKRGH
ncbi:MAG: hypothetical protein RLY20_3094 [Verrucomicrobiota bacterium]|jgi:peptidoglycan/xylan/chitin deacetylase (PgdA/CDA1 family)